MGAHVTSGLLMLPLMLGPLTPLGCLLLRFVVAHDLLVVRVTWWLWVP
jgi:hypothetical protein